MFAGWSAGQLGAMAAQSGSALAELLGHVGCRKGICGWSRTEQQSLTSSQSRELATQLLFLFSSSMFPFPTGSCTQLGLLWFCPCPSKELEQE